MPDFSLHTIKQLAPVALAATLFALTEAVSIARSLASRAHQHIDGNQEFIGQGLSNIAGSFFSAYVATGSFNRSGLNYQAGAKTPIAAVAAGVLLAGVVVVVAPLAAYLPNAAMAGILFLVAWGLIDFHAIKNVLRTSRPETAVLAVTFFSTLFLELEFAIMAGVLLSLVLYLNRTSRPQLLSRVPDPRTPGRDFVTDPSLPECPQLKLARLDGSLFFGAVSYVAETLGKMEEKNPGQKHLAISATGINFIDVAGAEFLADEASRRRAQGGGLYLIRLKPGVCEPLNRGGYVDTIGRENLFAGKTETIAAVVEKLDPEVCRTCTARIFRECAQRPGAEARPMQEERP
jgi:SulP family sulfate permease